MGGPLGGGSIFLGWKALHEITGVPELYAPHNAFKPQMTRISFFLYYVLMYLQIFIKHSYVLELYQPKRCGPWLHQTYRLGMGRVSVGPKAPWEELLPLCFMYARPFCTSRDVRNCVNTDGSRLAEDLTCGTLEREALPGGRLKRMKTTCY